MSDEEATNDASVTDFSVDFILETVLKKKSKIGQITLPPELSSGRRSFSNAARQKSTYLHGKKDSGLEKTIQEEKEENQDPIVKRVLEASTIKPRASDPSLEKPNPTISSQLKTPDTPKLSAYIPKKPSTFSYKKSSEIDTSYDASKHYNPVAPIIRSQNSRLGLCKSTSVLQTPQRHQNHPLANQLRRNISLDELTPKQKPKSEMPQVHIREPFHEQSIDLNPNVKVPENKKIPYLRERAPDAVKFEKEKVPEQKEKVPELLKTEAKAVSHTTEKAPEPQLPSANIITVNDRKYLKQKKIGEGGSSKVYSVIDMENWECRAVKVVLSSPGDASSFEMYKDEIKILQRLSEQTRVVRIFDYEELANELRIVMEVGSMDLGRILRNARQDGSRLTEFTIKHYWNEMLLAVQQIHAKGIIHLDLKPANFLLVGSMLKLIDFGIASSLQKDQTSILKDSQAGTYNYMSPESLTDVHQGPLIQCANNSAPVIKIGVKSDVWSLGCILYSMVYSKSPFQSITNILQKLTAISNASYQISFPSVSDQNLLDVMKSCLRRNPRERPSIEDLLKHPYLNTSVLS